MVDEIKVVAELAAGPPADDKPESPCFEIDIGMANRWIVGFRMCLEHGLAGYLVERRKMKHTPYALSVHLNHGILHMLQIHSLALFIWHGINHRLKVRFGKGFSKYFLAVNGVCLHRSGRSLSRRDVW